MKRKVRQNKEIAAKEFINSADSDHVTNDIIKPIKSVKFKPATFSLDEDTISLIEKLSIKSTKNKTSKSDVIKIATRYLNSVDQDQFEEIVILYKQVK